MELQVHKFLKNEKEKICEVRYFQIAFAAQLSKVESWERFYSQHFSWAPDVQHNRICKENFCSQYKIKVILILNFSKCASSTNKKKTWNNSSFINTGIKFINTSHIAKNGINKVLCHQSVKKVLYNFSC